MNPGVFQGAGQGVVAGTITRYIQTPPITSSQTVAVPPGTQRIEALVVGGGGAGGTSLGGGGGFGGAAIFDIPITGQSLQVIVGAGGTAQYAAPNGLGGNGSPTTIPVSYTHLTLPTKA